MKTGGLADRAFPRTMPGGMALATTVRRAAAPKPGSLDQELGRRRTGLLLLLLVACFALYAVLGVPHLTNNAVGDLEFSGWSGPIAEHLARGERPYVDFVLPIPPGSFALLLLVQKLAGRPLILQELWLNQICNLLMALTAYALVRPFLSRANALLVAFASLVVLLRVPKECAYDYTAELFAWLSVALGAQGLVASRRRDLCWLAAGFCAGFTFAFKQSTATGVVGGWLAAFVYFASLALAKRDRRSLEARLRDFSRLGLGAVLGLGSLVLLLHALGTSFSAYYQAIFVDGAPLKGGSIALGYAFVSYLLGSPAYPASLLLTLLAAGLLVRLARRPGALHLGELRAEDEIGRAKAAWIAIPALAAFGGAALLIAFRVPALPTWVAYWADRLRYVPAFGLLLGAVYFAAQLVPPRDGSVDEESRRRGHELNAITLVALITSLLHNLSSPEFRPVLRHNPSSRSHSCICSARSIALSLAARSSWTSRLTSARCSRRSSIACWRLGPRRAGGSLVGTVRERQRRPDRARGPPGAGARGGDRRSACAARGSRARALIGRPRPELTGAVIFVDQYAARLADDDLAHAREEPTESGRDSTGGARRVDADIRDLDQPKRARP